MELRKGPCKQMRGWLPHQRVGLTGSGLGLPKSTLAQLTGSRNAPDSFLDLTPESTCESTLVRLPRRRPKEGKKRDFCPNLNSSSKTDLDCGKHRELKRKLSDAPPQELWIVLFPRNRDGGPEVLRKDGLLQASLCLNVA